MHASNKRPLSERIAVLGWARRRLRNLLFGMAQKMSASDDGRDMLARGLEGLLASPVRRLDDIGPSLASPYADLGTAPPAEPAQDGTGAVIITGRFRSGSTLLWNLFRHMNGFTSYYEPLNERRWFDPASRGERVDPTHRKVSDYWAEYEGLGELAETFRDEWSLRHFLMDENWWDDDLLRYNRTLMARAKGRPVLQCNRIDFRLGWYRRHFPRAVLVHLYRHPRDQWCSALMDLKNFPPGGTPKAFEKADGFYLLCWCRDLKHSFPFLDDQAGTHPYRLFYFVWKLSFLFGRRHAHHSLAMESLVENPVPELLALFDVCRIDPATQDLTRLKELVVKPELGRWKGYAAESWFRGHEEYCEGVLADFFGPGSAAAPRTAPAPGPLQCVS
jgi:hypothetical protein